MSNDTVDDRNAMSQPEPSHNGHNTYTEIPEYRQPKAIMHIVARNVSHCHGRIWISFATISETRHFQSKIVATVRGSNLRWNCMMPCAHHWFTCKTSLCWLVLTQRHRATQTIQQWNLQLCHGVCSSMSSHVSIQETLTTVYVCLRRGEQYC